MEALICKNLGDPTIPTDVSSSPFSLVASHPIPDLVSPTSASARIRVKATSLNYLNFLQVQGLYQEKPPLPFIPGSDFSGPAVTKFKAGDRVCSSSPTGSCSQFVVADDVYYK